MPNTCKPHVCPPASPPVEYDHAHFVVDSAPRCVLFYEHAHIMPGGSPMRITAEAKAETRQRIIDVASKLFIAKGWENTTTRGIAAEAGIAAGTLFNYFDSKEAIVAALMSEALAKAQEEPRKRQTYEQS